MEKAPPMASSRLTPHCLSPPPHTILSRLQSHTLKSAGIFSLSGYSSMALTLELASRTGLTPQSTEGLPSLTVFAPSSAAFALSSPPSLSLLQYHLLPFPFSFHSFKSLPFGSKISTLLEGRSLFVTTSPSDDQCVSLNNVTVNRSLINVDGSFIIFGMDEFFDPFFVLRSPFFVFLLNAQPPYRMLQWFLRSTKPTKC